jgi:Protein of unknown function (DUF2851)
MPEQSITMNESFLHYIWQHQYFNREALLTTDGELINIFKQGHYNTHAGPDFEQAKIKIDNIEWAGSVEIHIKSSDYLVHNHQTDQAYENVILHVVWQNDKPIKRNDGTLMPTLELRTRISQDLVRQYRQLVSSGFQIPCSKSFSKVGDLAKVSMLEQAAVGRLQSKAAVVQKAHQQTQGDWDETFYRVLAKNFGFKVNSEVFEHLALALPAKLIRKNSVSLLKTEAMLFGVAGFLETSKGDEYYQSLRKEYSFQEHKFTLASAKLSKARWRFLRLRPANFPTIRLAQLAALLHQSTQLFSEVLALEDIHALKKKLTVTVSLYWQTHYSFGKEHEKSSGNMGEESLENILINSVIPVLAAYAMETGEEKYFDNALTFLQKLKPENNAIIRAWNELGLKATTALDSQGMIEQMNSHCKKRNCLNCTIGAVILKPATA